MERWETRQFGIVEYSEESVVEFPEGIPAFETDTRFVLIERQETAPLVFLQSLVHSELCFVTIPVEWLEPDYELFTPLEELRDLGIGQATPNTDVLCLAIVTALAGRTPTANLMAPVVIHRRTRRGRQVVQAGSRYSFEHPLGNKQEQALC